MNENPPAAPPSPHPEPQQPESRTQTAMQQKPPQTGYEFTLGQNETLRGLASKMKFVGIFYIVFASLFGMFGLVALFTAPLLGLVYLIAFVPQLLIGIWTNHASYSFRLIVDTKGHDIAHLMSALLSLRRLYALQFWVLIGAIALVIIAMIVGALVGLDAIVSTTRQGTMTELTP